MSKLPNAQGAVVELRKLGDYCLSKEYPRGKHKARVFASVLGLATEDAEKLREALLAASHSQEAVPTEEDEYGVRHVLGFEMRTGTGAATVRGGWMVRSSEGFPRSTSCWVL